MDTVIQHIINGLTLGSMYALLAVGLSFVFGVARLVNFAHGELYMLGSYFLLWFLGKDVPYVISILLVMTGMAIVGAVFQKSVVQPVIDSDWRTQLIATLGASIVLSNGAIMVWGTTPQFTPTNLSRSILRVGFLNISYQRIFLMLVTILVFMGLFLFVKYTRVGKAMRAVSQNREACTNIGINVNRIALVTFIIGSSLAGLAGAIITPLYSIYPAIGSVLTIKALVSVVMGGFGQTTGVIAASMILGLVEAFFAGYISYGYRDVAAFAILIIVLIISPEGLFSKKVGI